MDQAVAQNQDLADRPIAALRQNEFALFGQRIVPLAPNVRERPLCHALGIKNIAEHVESEQTMAQIRGLGVDFGLGFGIHAPQPLSQPAAVHRSGA